jgi:hypothetical protein
MPLMRDILIVLLAAVVLAVYLLYAPYVLEYARYLVCYIRLVVLGGECTAPVP